MISDKDAEFITQKVFADFLNRLVSGDTKPEEWQNLVINHYIDDKLEEIRRQLVRLAISSPDRHNWEEQDKAQILTWRNELLKQI
jgi:hypothetical protein